MQGGGCLTPENTGLLLGGGFGSFSRKDGTVRESLGGRNHHCRWRGAHHQRLTNADLFWALKGGGGGSYGVVTRLTLRTHELAEYFGGVFTTIRAASDAIFRRLIGQFVEFYAESLLNPHWGDIVTFQRDNNLVVRMAFQGIDRQQAQAVWQPFLGGVAASGSSSPLRWRRGSSKFPPAISGIRYI